MATMGMKQSYISEEKYENVDIGDYIKLPLREDTVIRMLNRR